ncbi:hypothetical protein L1987_43465 [Smallanthus sonchifolius]|uniref:Uncharacterized protein n=1 Tax=Smallanthus sonchifolius TaxID=185202 RepID=A0ACB9GMP9_9ASTR|nr:hypothetical protein L1987_43465 [Smallanthus sonchifolius]
MKSSALIDIIIKLSDFIQMSLTSNLIMMLKEDNKSKSDDEWDARSWDDVDLKLSGAIAFADKQQSHQ